MNVVSGDNECLEELNLSWNHIRLDGVKVIADALQVLERSSESKTHDYVMAWKRFLYCWPFVRHSVKISGDG